MKTNIYLMWTMLSPEKILMFAETWEKFIVSVGCFFSSVIMPTDSLLLNTTGSL